MATISDIARACGTSKTTVSLVMNGNDHKISAETRERVRDAMKRLDYRPSVIARGLSMQQSNSIGISTGSVAHVLSLQYYATIIAAIVDEATEFGLTVTLYSSCAWKKGVPDNHMFSDGRCDGLIFIGMPDSNVRIAIENTGVPRVAVNAGEMPMGVTSIDIDNAKAGYDATSHLISQGHRRIAYIHAGIGEVFSAKRYAGYLAALANAGIHPDDRLVWSAYNNLADGYAQAANIIEDRSLGITGVFCATDLLALGVIQGLRDVGVKVPADMSVIGVDGMHDGASSFPKLTTIDQHLDRLGIEAVRTLVDIIENPGKRPTHIVWPADLIVRESVAAFCMAAAQLVVA